MRRFVLASVGALAVAAAPGVAAAQDAPDDDDPVYSKKEQRYKPKEGEYGGVTPGVIYPYDDKDYAKRIKRPTNRGKRKNRVTWIGHQPRGDGSRLFVQLSSEVEYSQQIDGKELKVYVHKGRLASRNAGRRMDTRHFESSVAEVQARTVGARRARGDRPARPRGVEITVRFKNPADVREAQASLTKEKDEYYYLFLDFGAGTKSSGSP